MGFLDKFKNKKDDSYKGINNSNSISNANNPYSPFDTEDNFSNGSIPTNVTVNSYPANSQSLNFVPNSTNPSLQPQQFQNSTEPTLYDDIPTSYSNSITQIKQNNTVLSVQTPLSTSSPFQKASDFSAPQNNPSQLNNRSNQQLRPNIELPPMQGGTKRVITKETVIQNNPVNNHMPAKAYTKEKHMVPINKIMTSKQNSSSKDEKISIVKEVISNILPFNLGKKLQSQNSDNSNEDISIIDEGSISVQDFIAPSAIEVDFNEMRIGNKFVRTIFAIDYKFSSPGMLEQIVNYEEALDISMYYYPINSGEIVKKLRQKISEFEASLNLDLERGRVPDAYMKVNLQDAIKQQELLASGIEKWFNFALYITIKADTVKELNNMTQALLSILASKEISAKTASLAMEKAFQSAIPVGIDKLFKVRNMDTTSIANTFPFTSSDLSMDKGIMYGINTYNRSLVIFDRFAMPNANMVVFATSGAGKSFMVKLEALRSLMLGIEILVIDPENEYQSLARSIGGAYISFSQDGANKVNPFELPGTIDSGEDELKLKELSLIGFFKLAFGNLTNTELAVLERAIRQAYFEKGITNNPATHRLEAPRLEDLYKVFKAGIEPEAAGLADRLEKFIIGSASGIFDKKTNVDVSNPFTVFSIRDLSEELKPLAMYFMMDFIWNRVKRDPKKRILIVDEAWLLMRYPESALFINSIAKRARKYYLGLTVISQNVDDFLQSDIGTAVVTNSSIQVLLKQHPSAIDRLQKVFYLSDGEKNLLLGASIGMGLFFADNNHVAIEIKASDQEYKLCSTRPQEVHDKKDTTDEDNAAKLRAIPRTMI